MMPHCKMSCVYHFAYSLLVKKQASELVVQELKCLMH